MTIEWVPPTLEKIPEINIRHREADVTCKQCGVLGNGTVSAIQGRDIANQHDQERPDHEIKVVEVVCFM